MTGSLCPVRKLNWISRPIGVGSASWSKDRTLGFAMKFSTSLVAKGKVFDVSSTQMTAYGLLP